MKFDVEVLSGDQIAKHVLAIKPTKVAVAYLGRSWREYLPDVAQLEAVIVSPTLGTNPWAVEELAGALTTDGQDGWERIHFLDELHAKLYLGATAAVWGSANLSANGMSGDRLVELCAVSSDPDALAELGLFFLDVLRRAKRQYPTGEVRRARISELKAQTTQNPSLFSLCRPTGSKHLLDFKLLHEQEFYVMWYRTDLDDPDLVDSTNLVLGQSGSLWTHGLPNDAEPGRYILAWPVTSTLKPSRSKRFPTYWIRVDRALPDALEDKDDEYSCVYAQLPNSRSSDGDDFAPFSLDDPEVCRALLQAMQETDLADAFIQKARVHDRSGYSMKLAAPSLPLLLERMQAIYRTNVSTPHPK